jgi:hypothetical protein
MKGKKRITMHHEGQEDHQWRWTEEGHADEIDDERNCTFILSVQQQEWPNSRKEYKSLLFSQVIISLLNPCNEAPEFGMRKKERKLCSFELTIHQKSRA